MTEEITDSVEEQPVDQPTADINDDDAFADFLNGGDEAPEDTDDAGEEAADDDTDDDDTDDAGEPEEEPEEEGPPPPIADPAALIAMPDGTVDTLENVLRGTMRTADYTRKTQEVAEKRRQLESALTGWAIQGYAEPNWGELARTNPAAYIQEQENFRQYNMRREQAHQAWLAMQQENEAETAQRIASEQAEAAKVLREQIPELKSPKTAKVVVERMTKAAEALGYTMDEMRGISDPRMYRGLHLIAQALDIQDAKPAITKKVSATSKALPTGARLAKPSDKAKAKAARQRLKETGGADDAFAAFLFGT